MTEITTGEYHDVVVEALTDDDPTVEEMIRVRTSGGQRLWYFPGRASDDRFEPGECYHLGSVLGYDPTGEALPSNVREVQSGEWHCPECGEPTEFRPDLVEPSETVRATVDEQGIDDLVLVETDETTITPREGVDDWSYPDGIGASRERRDPVPDVDLPGEFVCPHCGHTTEDARTTFLGEEVGAKTALQEPNMGQLQQTTGAASAAGPSAAEPEIGMATGGAKDVTNFRDNIEEGYLPQEEALSDEGLFYDYYFDTGEGAASDGLFYPTYSAAVTEHPLSGDTERYLTVGLNSTLTEADFERKALDLVAVLDVSGSMSSQFDQYYYDQHGRKREVGERSAETKMEAACDSLVALTEQLESEDRFGVVLYNSDAGVAKPVRDVETTDMDAIRGHIQDIQAGGGTNMAAGYESARDLLEPYLDADPGERETRIVFMTDAMPNLGETGQGELVNLIEDAAAEGIYTTFVGMGIDSNAELIDALSGVRGANHYFVHSAEEFERRLGDEFAYMVTPLVFDLSVDVVADGYEIDAVYGSPNADAATGEVMHVATLFPSASEDGKNRGGVILLKLRQTGPDPDIDLEASWVRRDGTRESDTVSVTFPDGETERFENSGVRKAVLLARYADLLRDWIAAVRSNTPVNDTDGEEVDDWQHGDRSEWERESVPLSVPEPFGEEFERFHDHLVGEMEAIGDDDLEREAETLSRLVAKSGSE